MSKCKAVLDSNKITEIKVRTKAQENLPTGTEKKRKQSSVKQQPK